MKPVFIAGRPIGPENACLIIAEAGVNHNGQLELAHSMIDAAADAQADAIKFQAYQTDLLVTSNAMKAAYQMTGARPGESQAEMLRQYELTEGQFSELKDHCENRGILFLSSAFDVPSVKLLVRLGVPALKFGSGELTNLPLLVAAATYGIPLIISTGMSTLGEVEQAVISAKGSENENVILLHCTSNYPANPAHANLKAIQTLQTAFGVPVGYSDHTAGITVTLGAVACGACILEKHFTLNRELPGPDQSSSLQPEEFQELVRQVRVMESAMGNGIKIPAPGEADTARVARKSIVARVDIPAGELLTENHLMIKRPGIGLPPAMLHFVVGRTARITILKDECIRIDMLQ